MKLGRNSILRAAEDIGTQAHRRSRGFTLVEMMITVGLLLMVTAGGISSIVFLRKSSARNADHVAVLASVHERMESVRALNYTPGTAGSVFQSYTWGPVYYPKTLSLGKSGSSYMITGTNVLTITPSGSSAHLVTVKGTYKARGSTNLLVVTLQTIVNQYSGGQQ